MALYMFLGSPRVAYVALDSHVSKFLMDRMKVKVLVAQSCPALFNPMDCSPRVPLSMEFSRQEY